MPAINGGNRGGQAQSQPDGGPVVVDRPIICCVRLQVLLYYSFWFDILFAFLQVLAGWAKYRWIEGWTIWSLFWANYIVCFCAEPCRLYLGYRGNLGERVPELFLFVFICLSLMVFFVAQLALYEVLPWLQPPDCTKVTARSCLLPLEKACWIVRLVFYLLELIFGIFALRRLIHEQSARFFVSLEASEDFSSISRYEEREMQEATLGERRGRILNSPGQGAVQDSSGISAQIFGRPLQSPSQRPHAD
eukprot:TRINITY_DN26199_c1_g1_i1.p1 TRINITY_DN26199_c1_g1~~TRINITY_DN26199_c1_g1_i1.p1  ORF type:complete len:248 (-),score=21.42 TRINITY_DN26199_c1_g1_i1:103-846(-)